MKKTTALLTILITLVTLAASVSVASAAGPVVCPTGYICTPTVPVAAVVCPVGYVCTPQSAASGSAATPTYVQGSFYRTYLSGAGSVGTTNTATRNSNTNVGSSAGSSASSVNQTSSTISTPLSSTGSASTITEAPIVPDSISMNANSASYTFSVNYNQSLEEILSSINIKSMDDNIALGMFSPTTSIGQANLNARVFTVSELLPNATPAIVNRCIAEQASCPDSLRYSQSYQLTYDQVFSALKAKGYRPVTLMELASLIKTRPQIYGYAFGSITKSSRIMTYGLYVTNLSTSVLNAPFISSSKQVGLSQVVNVNGVITIGNATSKVLSEPIIAVQDNAWVLPSISTIPNIEPPTTKYVAGTHYGVPSMKFTVQVDYSKYTQYKNDYVSTGSQQKTMKILTIRGSGSDRTSYYEVKSLLPAGYRLATAAEMVALDSQYPNVRGNKGFMSLGTFNESCKGYPFIHPKVMWQQAENGGSYFDDRRYFNSSTMASGVRIDTGSANSYPEGFEPKINEMLFPIVQI